MLLTVHGNCDVMCVSVGPKQRLCGFRYSKQRTMRKRSRRVVLIFAFPIIIFGLFLTMMPEHVRSLNASEQLFHASEWRLKRRGAFQHVSKNALIASWFGARVTMMFAASATKV